MSDAAVDALADRLSLKLSFRPQTGQRFTPAEVTEVKAAALAAIAQCVTYPFELPLVLWLHFERAMARLDSLMAEYQKQRQGYETS
jgi:hypothetical protein